jgi:ABC-type polar amino acid transport system ATPase subunit
MKNVLEARDVVKVFEEGSQRVEVLRGVSLNLAAGEVVALEGPSGSGKTTLLSIMGCILTPTSGEVRVDGRPVDGDPDRLRHVRRRSIGFVFQQYNLFPALTALENVEYSLNVRGTRGRPAHAEAKRVLARVGLGDRLGFLPRDLSGGQKQRVAIARALCMEPKVLMFDEPTSALDPELVGEVLTVMEELAHEGTTMIVVTHEMHFAREAADTVIYLDDGLIVEAGPPDQVLSEPRDERTKRFLRRFLSSFPDRQGAIRPE